MLKLAEGTEPTYILRENPWIFSEFIEVKSKADSLGKILRELNFYHEFFLIHKNVLSWNATK